MKTPNNSRKHPATQNALIKDHSSLVLDRLVYTPAEFAGLFGRHPVWGYRQIYAGRIRILKHGGRMMIPKAEVETFLKSVTVYSGRLPKGVTQNAHAGTLASNTDRSGGTGRHRESTFSPGQSAANQP